MAAGMEESPNIQIKVCGMREPRNLEQLCALQPEYIGFIFYPPSPRFVGSRPDPALFRIPGPDIKKVGVFVDEVLHRVEQAIERFGLDAVQLHGHESVKYCRQLARAPVEIIKVLDPRGQALETGAFGEVADLFLFDSAGAGKGGTGLKFDWNLLGDLNLQFPFLLSGGIGPEDAGRIRSLDHRGFRGIDINSRFELSPGLKDMELLKRFIIEIRK
jgi:phosphoribosylanthranilate isomerase